jgi:hypothetical protein
VGYTFIVYIIELCLILALAVYLKNKLSIPYIVLSGLIFVTIISECLSNIAAHQMKNNSTVFHSFAPIEFALLSIVFYLLFRSKILKQIVFIIIFLFSVFVVFNAIYLQPITHAPFNDNTVASIILITYSFLLFGEMINLEIENSLFSQAIFWFNSGVLIFYTATLIFWGIYHLIQLNSNIVVLHHVLWILNLIYYAFFGISIYLAGRKTPD